MSILLSFFFYLEILRYLNFCFYVFILKIVPVPNNATGKHNSRPNYFLEIAYVKI